jgi:hypothetical protein
MTAVRFAQIAAIHEGLADGSNRPLLPFPVGTRYGRNVHMSGPSVEQGDWGWHFG